MSELWALGGAAAVVCRCTVNTAGLFFTGDFVPGRGFVCARGGRAGTCRVFGRRRPLEDVRFSCSDVSNAGARVAALAQ